MFYFVFIISLLFLLITWWNFFNSEYWNENIAYQLIMFISPVLLGLIVLIAISNLFSLEIIRQNKHLIYFFSSLVLFLLIPQWYKLAWVQLKKAQSRLWYDSYKLIFAVLLAVFMVLAMVIFFALFYLLINSISGNNQGLLAAYSDYYPSTLDFGNALYFSFVTYFSLGYGDLVPYGIWMRTFVFLECLSSLLNTGIIAIYVYNFLFTVRK
jgi:voltage-gated potassium channel